jgi:hypothetical protein
MKKPNKKIIFWTLVALAVAVATSKKARKELKELIFGDII